MLSEKILRLMERRGFRELTDIQKKAVPLVAEGKNCLAVAPTGWGKTEAALLPLLDMITQGEKGEGKTADGETRANGERKGIRVLYITPLRALNRDVLERMFWWCENLGIEAGVRHGDTSQAERAKQLKNPPQLLITTPETLQALLCAPKMRENLKTIKAVVVDEVHELYADKRGAQLSIALERLEELVKEGKKEEMSSEGLGNSRLKTGSSIPSFFQRIGLSATVGDVEGVAGFLAGVGRECVVARVEASKQMELQVLSPTASDEDKELAEKMHVDLSAAARLKLLQELMKEKRTLVFTNTRAVAEVLCSRLLALGASVGVHHGSLSKEVRENVEKKFKRGELKGLIATSSLELGIDVGDVEKVIQFMSPRVAQRLVQRVGRSGHSVKGIARGEIIASDADDVLEAMAVVRLAREGKLEKEGMATHAYSVVAHQIIGVLVERRGVKQEAVFTLVKRAKPFEKLSFETFLRICEQMRAQGLLRIEERNGEVKTRSENISSSGIEHDLVKTGNSRDYYYTHLSTIPSERKFRVRNAATNSIVSSLDEAFTMSLQNGELFITKGVPWRVLDVNDEEVIVEPAQTFDAAVPDWEGEEIPVPLQVAREIGRIRRGIAGRKNEDALGKPNAEKKARNEEGFAETGLLDFHAEENAVEKVNGVLKEQEVLPTEKRVFIECFEELLVVHVCGGTLANAAIAKALSFMLNARFGSSVRAESDASRVMLRLPQPIGAEEVKRMLLEIKDVGRLLEAEVKNTPIYRFKFIHAARAFGMVGEQARIGRKLIEKLSGTIAGEEALRDVFRDYVNVEEANELLKEMREGKIEVVARNVGRLSPLAQLALNRVHASELIAPVEPNSEILKAFRKEIEGKNARFTCAYCSSIFYSVIEKLGKKIECEKCGGRMVALAEREQDAIVKSKGAKGKRKEYLELMRSASLIEAYGKRAVA
ncbi:DEAD/DEAH box helicase, partial [Candidatus Micrarchaeota archaeon]|nr:DEAD/DEAH box helicase [Candidatus Micrarchaeota archaeon]